MDYSTITAPTILGTASLIAFVSVRSTSIADRIRTAVREIVAADTVAARRENLIAQLRGLKHRYASSTYAMIFLLLAFAGFVVMAALASAHRPGATPAFGVGIAFGMAGFALTLYEVVTSPLTLFTDTAYAEALYRDRNEKRDGTINP